MNESALQYFHAYFNYKYFDNKLEPCVIKAKQDEDFCYDEGIEARTFTETVPFMIRFYNDVTNEDPVYLLQILLHEMIHQYCRENEIDDCDIDGVHLPAFKDIAAKHGLQSGYMITNAKKKEFKEVIAEYEQMYNIDL